MSERKHDMPKPEEISGILAAYPRNFPGLVKESWMLSSVPEAAADMGKCRCNILQNPKRRRHSR